jgi:hypothetical protein
MKRQKITVSSTHLDSQGYVMTKEALESMLPYLNGKRKVRLGLEHIRTFPPFGVIMNGEIIQGNDNHFYLTAESIYFDKQSKLTFADGTELLKEFFSEGSFPFVECKPELVSKINISTDPTNFKSHEEVEEFFKIVADESGLEFDSCLMGRKSELPDPETVIAITKTIAIALGILKTKIHEKIGEAVGEDLAKFYKFISSLAVQTIKRAIPANRPKNFVIEFPNEECIVELVITTHVADKVLQSLTKQKLAIIDEKINQLINLNPEKIQFIYNKEDEWEFNYLLSRDGAVIGQVKSFNKRNKLYNDILKAQEEKG